MYINTKDMFWIGLHTPIFYLKMIEAQLRSRVINFWISQLTLPRCEEDWVSWRLLGEMCSLQANKMAMDKSNRCTDGPPVLNIGNPAALHTLGMKIEWSRNEEQSVGCCLSLCSCMQDTSLPPQNKTTSSLLDAFRSCSHKPKENNHNSPDYNQPWVENKSKHITSPWAKESIECLRCFDMIASFNICLSSIICLGK